MHLSDCYYDFMMITISYDYKGALSPISGCVVFCWYLFYSILYNNFVKPKCNHPLTIPTDHTTAGSNCWLTILLVFLEINFTLPKII